jgi:hypothetical protein
MKEAVKYELDPLRLASGRWSVPCPICQLLVEAATHEGVAQAVCDHANATHPVRFFGDAPGRDS